MARPSDHVDGARLWRRLMELSRFGARPDGGVDRQTLTEAEIAARAHLVALGRFLLLPEDDLTLANVLKGPLFGFDDDRHLFPLAHGRGRSSLWQRLGELAGPSLDAGQVARVAHAIKGSSGNLGAMTLQDVASRLEQAGHRGESADVLARLTGDLQDEYARVEQYLRGVLAERAGTDSALQGF